MLGDGETKPRPAMRARHRGISLAEWLENLIELVLGDADTRILDRKREYQQVAAVSFWPG